MLGVYTIVRTTDFGWGSAHTIGFGATAIALVAAFVVRERLTSNPLLPLRIFRSRNLSGANAVLMLMVAGMFGMFFLGTLYLQRVLGYDPIQVGLAFLPVSLGIGALSLGVSAPLVTRFGRAPRPDSGARPAHPWARPLLARAARGELRHRSAAGHGAARRGRRARVPGADL